MAGPEQGYVYRHGWIIRATHWLNAVAVIALLITGFGITQLYTPLHWGDAGQDWGNIGQELNGSGVDPYPVIARVPSVPSQSGLGSRADDALWSVTNYLRTPMRARDHIHLTKRIHNSVEESLDSGASSLISSRIYFARVNSQLTDDLHRATAGGLNGESFSHLLLYGWLPQQTQKKVDATPARAGHTRLTVVRYQDLNRFIAVFWDPSEAHEIVLTLQRASVFHRWHVTKVVQFNVCAYDFDCSQVPLAELPTIRD